MSNDKVATLYEIVSVSDNSDAIVIYRDICRWYNVETILFT